VSPIVNSPILLAHNAASSTLAEFPDVARHGQSFQLPCEDLVVSIIVADCSHCRAVRIQRQRRQGMAFAQITSDELSRQMLGVGRAAAVAEEESLMSGTVRRHERIGRRRQLW